MCDQGHAKPLTPDDPPKFGPGMRVWVGGHNRKVKREIRKYLAGTIRATSGLIDVALIAPESVEEALYFGEKLRHRMAFEATVWVVEPTLPTTESVDPQAVKESLIAGMMQRGYVKAGATLFGGCHVAHAFRPIH